MAQMMQDFAANTGETQVVAGMFVGMSWLSSPGNHVALVTTLPGNHVDTDSFLKCT